MKNRKHRKTTLPKAKHYRLEWDIIKALEVVDQYEKTYGSAQGLPYIEQCKIYQGNLLPAIHFGKIDQFQRYGVQFDCKFYTDDNPAQIIQYSMGYRIPEPMTIKELIDGCDRVYTDLGHGLTVKGWKGASRAWLDELEADYGHNITWIEATAVANCLVKPTC